MGRFTTRATRRYLVRLLLTMLVYLLTVFFAKWSFQHLHPTGALVYLLALLPSVPMVGSLAIVGLYSAEETDEFERFILIQSMLWGLGASLTISTVWGTLEEFTHRSHLSTFYAYTFFWIFMAISGVVIRLRYR
ncbi:MAG TPA: hypothetical protein VL346_09980 [Acidobacteriaceae bacterium]|nr:hypothetical protein [Acidobacteriaceae bacterium]